MNSPKLFKFISMIVIVGMLTSASCVNQDASVENVFAQESRSVLIQGADTSDISNSVIECGGTVTSTLDIIDAVGAVIDDKVQACLDKALPDLKYFDNSKVEATKDYVNAKKSSSPATDYPDVVGADLVWKEGITGKGVTVAVVDSGFENDSNIINGANIKRRLAGWVDFVDKSKKPVDPNGHGTHVAGIIANSDKGTDKEWNGLAPNVRLVGVRVLDETGAGTYERVIQGIEWVIKHKDKYNIRVMNLSMNATVQSPYWADPLNQAVTAAWAEGIVVVVAAGNTGSDAMTIGVPGNNPYVITVGAFTDNYTPSDWNDDYITPFSSAGPTLDGFAKPDLVAPGAHIVSLMNPNAYIAENHNANWVTDRYFEMAGTSQSAAVVSGVVALMLSNYPDMSPDQVKYKLMVTALPWINPDDTTALYSVWQQGAGRLNAVDAVMTDAWGEANANMDIWSDLAGDTHYEGSTYYNPDTGEFILQTDVVLPDAYGIWSGAYGIWSGGYGTWGDTYGIWSGAYGIWSGSVGISAEAYGIWSGAYGIWSGAYGIWSGGYDEWTGDEPWADSAYASHVFVNNFLNGETPDVDDATAELQWVEE